MDRQGDGSNASTHRVYCGEAVLWRGSPTRELEPIAAYRLEVDKGGGWRSPRKITRWENPQWPSDLPEIMA
jgi:hypothetical protein